MASYPNTSPWSTTPIVNNALSHLEIRPVSAEADDYLYQITPAYNHRPDLLAYDLYGTTKLWWVFTQRNMDVIRDPIFDFTTGTYIYIPKQPALFRTLGL